MRLNYLFSDGWNILRKIFRIRFWVRSLGIFKDSCYTSALQQLLCYHQLWFREWVVRSRVGDRLGPLCCRQRQDIIRKSGQVVGDRQWDVEDICPPVCKYAITTSGAFNKCISSLTNAWFHCFGQQGGKRSNHQVNMISVNQCVIVLCNLSRITVVVKDHELYRAAKQSTIIVDGLRPEPIALLHRLAILPKIPRGR